jgi:serine phosphatase RsbU (regulator of sigma subunit)/anti-sigma regulatory factor (Ser/Thr protein kinase)
VSASVVRRIRLPADRHTPAAAREVVRSVLAEVHLPELLDEALLLTTELSTNGVLHAGTEIDLEVVAGPDGLTVTVTDFDGQPLAITRHNGSELSERGRGLLLVDHFAASWGTTHHAKGKGVWFRLIRPGTGEPELEPGGSDHHGPISVPSPAALASLAEPEPPSNESIEQHATRLLIRLCGALGATGGMIRLDRADGRGLLPIASYGLLGEADNFSARPGAQPVLVPVNVSWPWRGELVLTTSGPAGPYAAPLAMLTAERLGLALENDRLRHADLRRQAWLTFLAEASELLAQSLDVQLTMALIPRLVVPRLGQWCAVYGADEWGDPQFAAGAHADETALPALLAELSRAGTDTALSRLREAVRTGGHVPLPAPVDGIAVPLIARGQRLGALVVGRHLDHRHDAEEIAIVDDVARRAALAMDNARIHAERRRVAQTLQQSLLPPTLPVVAGIAFGAEYSPTQGDADVGGDFYDVVPMPDGRWLVVIGDVSGKGVQAATVTGLVRDVIRVLVRDGRRLPDIIARINETLVERGGGRYCTLAMAAVGFGPDHRLDLSLHLAGHDRPVKVCADGKASFVGVPGTALGLLGQVKTPSLAVTLEPGDTLIFYTDGVTERRRGAELFGIERLRAAAGPLAGYAADVVAARLRAVALAFSTEPPRDDIAILTLRNDVTP